MGIYHKNTSNITKIADIYLKQTSAITRICKVYICTAANTFQLVYDGCAACNCETFCNSFCGGTNSTCYCMCVYNTSPAPTSIGVSSVSKEFVSFGEYNLTGVCGCDSLPPDQWAGPIPTTTECTNNWCYLGVGNCPSPGCFSNTFWLPCDPDWEAPTNCESTPESCVCPLGEVNSAFCPVSPGGPLENENEELQGPVWTNPSYCEYLNDANCYNISITYVCRNPCCVTSPTGGYTTCNDYDNNTLETGDWCCRTKMVTQQPFFPFGYQIGCYSGRTGAGGLISIPPGEQCCETNLTCATP